MFVSGPVFTNQRIWSASSPKEFLSPDLMHELPGKVSDLEQQLEMEIQQKVDAMMKVETLDNRVSELEQQLQTETQQKQDAQEKVEMLELRVSELEGHLKEQSNNQSNPDDQVSSDSLMLGLVWYFH